MLDGDNRYGDVQRLLFVIAWQSGVLYSFDLIDFPATGKAASSGRKSLPKAMLLRFQTIHQTYTHQIPQPRFLLDLLYVTIN